MNVNEELKNNIINNLNNLKEKKQQSIANKNKQKQPPNQNNPGKQHKKSKPHNKQKRDTPDLNGEAKNKFDKLDKNILDKFNRFGSAKKAAAQEPEEIEPEENKIDYADFIKSQNEADDGEEKYEIIGVRFKPVGKIYFFLPADMSFKAKDKVIVETSRGLEMGTVVFGNRFVSVKKIVQPLKPIMRPAADEDAQRVERNKKAAGEAMKIAEERIKAHSLKMKLIDAEYTFDNSKLIYYFTHEGRVDFRELVKDLASIFKIRIELRQIGVRDQTKILGGLSICGRPFCCNSFLQEFEQCTIKMAKDQNISINSTKISGACGRLMCCLKYEHETYEQLNKDMPRTGALVETSEGENGIVIECNALTGMCRVKITRSLNQRGDSSENTVKSYSKKQLKITGYLKKEQDAPEENLADLEVVVEDGPVKSGIDIEV